MPESRFGAMQHGWCRCVHIQTWKYDLACRCMGPVAPQKMAVRRLPRLRLNSRQRRQPKTLRRCISVSDVSNNPPPSFVGGIASFTDLPPNSSCCKCQRAPYGSGVKPTRAPSRLRRCNPTGGGASRAAAGAQHPGARPHVESQPNARVPAKCCGPCRGRSQGRCSKERRLRTARGAAGSPAGASARVSRRRIQRHVCRGALA